MKKLVIVFSLVILLFSCNKPLSEDKSAFVGLWKNNETSLLITQAGRIEYKTKKGSISKSISMPIKTIDENGIDAGLLFFSSSIKLGGYPKKEDEMIFLQVNGEQLFKADNLGRVIQATRVPPLAQINTLVMKDLKLLAKGINNKDFSDFIQNASLLFQSNFNNEKMISSYKVFIDRNIDLNKWMTGNFVLTKEPGIDAKGILTINGEFETSSDSLKFETSYIYSYPRWKCIASEIEIN